MKKISIVMLMMAMVAIFSTPSFAQLRKDLAYVKGKVVYVNATRNEITVKDPATGKDVTFAATKGVDAGIAAGNTVTIIYKKGTANATTIRLSGAAAPAAKGSMAAQPAMEAPAKKSTWY